MWAPRRGSSRPKAYLSIGEYLRKAGAFKTVNVYYNNIISTHPSVAFSDNGDDEDVDELAQGMIDAAQHGHLETLRSLAAKAQTGGEEGGIGTCIGERVASLMLHLAAEYGHEAIVHYLVEDLWVDVDTATVRDMTALHYAAKANRTAVVRELARLGADLEAKNDSGMPPAAVTKDRLLKRLFQQYLGGMELGENEPLMMDRFAPRSDVQVVDYVAVMTVKLAPQLMPASDVVSDIKTVTVSEMWRFPPEDHSNTPMADASNLAEICTQMCQNEGGPLPSYGTLLTNGSGARSFVWSKVLGVYQDAAQRGRARVSTTLCSPGESNSVTAGEVTARIVIVLSRQPYTEAYAAICEHVGTLILEEAPKWGSLAEWPLDMELERNAHIKFCLETYATDLPVPLPSRQAELEVMGQVVKYGDAHASHSSLPYLEESHLRCLTSKLGPDMILAALSCLLQEQSLLIISDRVEDLTPATSALLGLMFPLRWPHTVIPVLPASLVHYLDAPVPFLMGMHQRGLQGVSADLSSITIVNLAINKVVLPIRPITSVSTMAVVDATGKEPKRRRSRRDSMSRLLAELPTALRTRAESRLRRCVPLGLAPASDRVHHQARASSLYTPGLRVAVADVMVDLFGPSQSFRYVEASQPHVLRDAPEDHRKLLEAIFSTQSWRIFREDLREEYADGQAPAESWEDQAQLFCACVERARHRGGAAASAGESHSCQDVLYPSEDVEEQLALLSVYPEPGSIVDEGSASGDISPTTPTPGAGESPSKWRIKKAAGTSPQRSQASASSGASKGGGELNLQEKTDEVLRSITTSFATVTDMFGGGVSKAATPPHAPGVKKSGADCTADDGRGGRQRASSEHRQGAGGDGGGGWDLFKPPSMADMKRRLEGMTVGGVDLSPPKVPPTADGGGGAAKGRRRTAGSNSMSPARKSSDAASAAGLAMIGDSWRDLRRRSTEVMNDAVTKFKSALDDSDDEGGIRDAAGGRAGAGGDRVRAAAAKARASAGGEGDDDFWKPFGDRVDDSSGGEEDDDGEPVPLPTSDEVRREREKEAAKGRSTSAKAELNAYYGGGR